jgi:hypothetical protein
MDIANKIGENMNKITNKIPTKEHISGIHCEVTNCSFHDPSCKCSANQIKVGPTFAASNADTVCSTFKVKP